MACRPGGRYVNQMARSERELRAFENRREGPKPATEAFGEPVTGPMKIIPYDER